LGSGLLFCGITGGFAPLSNFSKYLKLSGLPSLEKAKVQWRGWHAFRRAFATNLYHKEVNEVTVQSLMGHKEGSTITREHYNKPQNDRAKAAVTLLN
jgi:integrase